MSTRVALLRSMVAFVVQPLAVIGSAARAVVNACVQRTSDKGVELTTGSEIDKSALSGMHTSLHTSHSALAFSVTFWPVFNPVDVCSVTRCKTSPS